MSKWATLALLAAIFGLAALFRDDWITLSAFGLAFGFAIALLAWRGDQQFRSFDSIARWAVLKFWMIGAFLIAILAAGFAYWRSAEGAAVSGAAAFLGVGTAAFVCEMLARRRWVA